MDSKLSSKQCGTCKVAIENDIIRRVHSKTPWHVENLRRRIDGLPPLDASTFKPSTTPAKSKGKTGKRSKTAAGDASCPSDSDESDDGLVPHEPPTFVPQECLFCNRVSESFGNNVDHMQKSHGLFLESLNHLIVDLETLVRYLHLIIFGYHECLYCHSRRRTAEAAQQHMRGKGHCNLDDIQNADSEYRDFFDFAVSDTVNGEDSVRVGSHSAANNGALGVSSSLRLASGRTISSRTATPGGHLGTTQLESRQRHHSPSTLPSSPDHSAEPAPGFDSSSQALSRRGEKHSAALSDKLTNLSINDRMSLAHLPSSQQRALLSTHTKQADKAQQARQRQRSRVEMLGNSTLTEHCIGDTPAMKLKYAWC